MESWGVGGWGGRHYEIQEKEKGARSGGEGEGPREEPRWSLKTPIILTWNGQEPESWPTQSGLKGCIGYPPVLGPGEPDTLTAVHFNQYMDYLHRLSALGIYN